MYNEDICSLPILIGEYGFEEHNRLELAKYRRYENEKIYNISNKVAT